MVARVKFWLSQGKEVRILTARASRTGRTEARRLQNIALIWDWCEKHIGQVLPVTSDKDKDMLVLYDDRARQVELNTGHLIPQPENKDEEANEKLYYGDKT